MNPSVTVLMPAHNAEPFIAQAVQSVLRQTETRFKLWILENGSSDRTAQIARSFTDDRIEVFELGSIGFQSALEFGLRRATTPWLARMDADDVMFPERLARQMHVLSANPKLAFVGTHHSILTPFGHVLERLPLPQTGPVDTARLATQRGFADPSVVFSREIALEVGGMDSDFTIGDVALWFRLLSKGTAWQIGEPLHLYRLVPTSHSRAGGRLEEAIRVRQKYCPNLIPRWTLNRRCTPFWAEVGALELIAGDRNAVQRCSEELERSGEYKEANRMRWRARTGAVGKLYYSFRNRTNYKHRPDLECLFQNLLGSPRGSRETLNTVSRS
jgi:glycosyltransferase involved in cell wall biosynthesis